MKLYQVEHDYCEPYEDSYSYREDKVYTNKEQLVKDIKPKDIENYKECLENMMASVTLSI
ncbi:hypothetical protein Koombakaat1_00055 [Staphylococcus phage Koomba-kaat_1]|nr:hypothetical protein Koombakaat1_00055 [Staphylococcus phage Koomba-kaat_1]